MTTLTLVVARADNGVIGRDGQLPWHLPEDLKRFRRLTLGKPVVMGRRTYDSIGKPLPGRRNIVLTRQLGWRADGVETAVTLDDALALAADTPEVAIIGGATVYAEALPRADRIELTEVHAAPAGDTFFPPLDPARWREIAREADAQMSFVTLVRR